MSPSRRRRILLDSILSSTSSAVCVLNEDRHIRFCSPGMLALSGFREDELEGLVCLPGIAPLKTAIEYFASAIAPPHKVLQGQIHIQRTVLPYADGTTGRHDVCHVPILDAANQVCCIVVLTMSVDTATESPSIPFAKSLHAEISALRLQFRQRYHNDSFLGNHPLIRLALEQASLLKTSECGYTIIGPPGSGRRHLAHMIHVNGRHADTSFIPVDCRLLTATNLLDNLRHLKRSRQESHAPHESVGTILFIDVDQLPREVQQWVLDNLQKDTANVRFVGTSQVRLQDVETQEWMIPDFRRLLSTIEVRIPSLHQRGEDVLLLAQHFVETCQHTDKTSAEGLSPEVQRRLLSYRWPGNVRELRQVVIAACESCFEVELKPEHLPFAFRAGLDAQQLPPTPAIGIHSLDDILKQFETDVLKQTLEGCDGNKAEAARRLGLTRPRFYRRLEALGLTDPE